MINYKHFILLAIVIGLLSVVRWNRQDLFIANMVGDDGLNLKEKIEYDVNINIDAYNYLQYVNYYRGKDVSNEVTKPYSFRFLSPLIASFIPLDSFSALNTVNLCSELLALLFLMKILALLRFKEKTIFFSSLIFSFSFPIFYYGVTGLVDPPAIFLITIGIYFVLKNRLLSLYLIFIIGAMTNEKVILLLPFFFFYLLKEKNLKISFIHSLAMFLVFIVTTYFVRKYTLNADSTFLWSANLEALLFNLGRIRTYLSLMLTGGVPIILLVVAAKHINYEKSYNFAFAAGVFFSILLIIYSLAAAYTDGRFMWYMYPFAIPLSAVAIEKYLSCKSVS